jgi:hypothetical protein
MFLIKSTINSTQLLIQKSNYAFSNNSNNLKTYKFNSLLSITSLSNYLVKVSQSFNKTFSDVTIKYSPSNFIKYIKQSNLNVYTILFLRKNKVFNKGRYSRNRQYYRTGVYWCLYVNIIAVVGIYFWFYRFNINFGYLWWLLYAFMLSFFIPKTVKYRLYNPLTLYNNYVSTFIWLYLVVSSTFSGLFVFLNNLPFFKASLHPLVNFKSNLSLANAATNRKKIILHIYDLNYLNTWKSSNTFTKTVNQQVIKYFSFVLKIN